MLWKVRFKHRQMMHEHVIETLGTTQAEADELAEHYLGEKFGTPNIRIVPPVEPWVAMRTADVPALAAKYGGIPPVGLPIHTGKHTVPSTEPDPSLAPPTTPDEEVTPPPAADPDDEMTAMAGPAVAKGNRAPKPRIGA